MRGLSMTTITEVITPTDEVLAGMMVENSGRSILDSGGEWTDHNGNYRETPYSLHERAKDRGVEGIACPEEDCSGILHA